MLYVLITIPNDESGLKLYGCTLMLCLTCSLPAFAQTALGYFVSSKASVGFFKTKIVLYDDSTFYWNFSGDLQYREAKGPFTKNKNRIVLLPIARYDTLPALSFREIGITNADTINMKPMEPTIIDLNDNMTKAYIWKNKKLIPISNKGKPIRKAKLVRVDKVSFENTHGFGVWKKEQ